MEPGGTQARVVILGNGAAERYAYIGHEPSTPSRGCTRWRAGKSELELAAVPVFLHGEQVAPDRRRKARAATPPVGQQILEELRRAAMIVPMDGDQVADPRILAGQRVRRTFGRKPVEPLLGQRQQIFGGPGPAHARPVGGPGVRPALLRRDGRVRPRNGLHDVVQVLPATLAGVDRHGASPARGASTGRSVTSGSRTVS